MARRLRWYEHVEGATALVPCQGEQHRITWRRGKVKVEDHDLGGERALLALGGQPCPCLRALRLWEDQFGLPPELFTQMPGWLGADAVLAPPELDVHRHLGMVLSWERSWKAHGYFSKQGKLIEREVQARGVPVVRAHLNAAKVTFGSRVVRSVDIRIVPAGRPLGMVGRMDRVSVSAEATLSSAWMVEVWARGISVIGDTFVLEVTDDDGEPRGSASVIAVRWAPGPGGSATPVAGPARVTPRPGGGWAVA